MYIDESTIEEIRRNVDIFDIISNSVQLKKAGRSFKGLCPFHQEKTPSFFVHPAKQTFNCFGCDTKGDVITFIMKYENLGFIDSIRKLAQIAGIDIKEKSDDPLSQKRMDLYKLNETASEWFQQNLNHPETGSDCLNYLKVRGLTETTIKTFRLGFALESWNSLSSHLLKKGYSTDLLVESGLSIMSDKTHEIFDRFRNRLIFPIFNGNGKLAGFSGRILENAKTPKETAKYLNSPESLIFKKSQLLFGMNQAKNHIVKSNEILLAEGHLDVCALHQNEFKNSVGVQGTAFSDQHAKWIKRYTKNIKIVFDGDSAGIKAAMRILPIGLAYEFSLKIAELPPKEDPASLLKSNSKEHLNSILEQSSSLFEYKIFHFTKNKAMTPELKVSTVNDLFEDLKGIKNPILTDSFIQIISFHLKLNYSSVQKQWQNFNSKPLYSMKKKTSRTVSPPVLLSSSEKELLRILLSNRKKHKDLFSQFEFEWILNSDCRDLIDYIYKLYCEKYFSIEKLTEKFQKHSSIINLIEWGKNFDYGENINQAIEETLKNLKLNFYKHKITSLTNQLEQLSSQQSELNPVLKQIDYYRTRLKSSL